MKIGFIGLGIMGKPMAKNLIAAGHDLRVNSRSSRAYAELEALGAVCCASAYEAAQGVDVLITMLPDAPQVEQVLFGENGAEKALKKGATVIDMSSVSPEFSRRAASRLAERGVAMLDAPVSGGEQGAVDGTLTIMAGGDPQVFEACRPVLLCMGKTATLIGGHGAGNVCKLVNQIIVASTLSGMSEAFNMAEKQGVDTYAVFEAIRHGMAGSALLEMKAPKMLARDFTPSFYLKLQAKDLRNARQTLESCGMRPLFTSAALDAMQSLIDRGLGEEDHSAIYRYFE